MGWDFPRVFPWEGPIDAKIIPDDAPNKVNLCFCESEGLIKKSAFNKFSSFYDNYVHLKFVA